MFFMMGITDGRKDFDFHQQIICDICGKNIELEAGAMVSDELQDGTCFNLIRIHPPPL